MSNSRAASFSISRPSEQAVPFNGIGFLFILAIGNVSVFWLAYLLADYWLGARIAAFGLSGLESVFLTIAVSIAIFVAPSLGVVWFLAKSSPIADQELQDNPPGALVTSAT